MRSFTLSSSLVLMSKLGLLSHYQAHVHQSIRTFISRLDRKRVALEAELQQTTASSSISDCPYRDFLKEVELNLVTETDIRVKDLKRQVDNAEKDRREGELDQNRRYKRRRISSPERTQFCKDELQEHQSQDDHCCGSQRSRINSKDAKQSLHVCGICHVVCREVRACVYCGTYVCRKDLFWCSNVGTCSFCVCRECQLSRPATDIVTQVGRRWLCPSHSAI